MFILLVLLDIFLMFNGVKVIFSFFFRIFLEFNPFDSFHIRNTRRVHHL